MKRSSVVFITLGVLLLIFAALVPPYMLGQARTLPKDLDVSVISESPQGYTRTEHIVTAPTEKIDEIRTRVDLTITDDSGQLVSEVKDELTLIGHSRFPVIEPTASISGSPVDSSNQTREGLHWFFPANALRNSYPFYDIILGTAEPVDYVSREDDIYTFYQDLRYAPLDETHNYSVQRTIEVEKNSGLIINKEEVMTFHDASGEQTVEFTYTDASRAEMTKRAEDINQKIQLAKILDFSSKFLGFLLIVIGAVKTGIFKRGELAKTVQNLGR
ncbi:porin PorA family protein [Corynebacterium callunae]|uniref:porin PorA family protein n=1 Tax=Corynebacterium callunae TaxID=1721 RepID=UPI003981A4F3